MSKENMNSFLFEQIDNAGLIKHGEVNVDAIFRLTAIDIIEFAQQSAELTSAKDLPRETELFTHSASLSLGGSVWPCAEIECRLNKAHQLAQFASFYSDKIYIHNFLEDHLKHLDSKKYPDEALMQKTLINDLKVLHVLRPLIESGLIVPISTPYHCPHCFVKHVLKQENDKRLVQGLEQLETRYNAEPTYSIYRDEIGAFNLRIIGPEDLLEHGYLAIVQRELQPCFQRRRELRKRILRGEEVVLSPKIVEAVQLGLSLADHVFQDAIFGLTTSQCLNSGFVTERELDISFINDITTDANIKRRNQIVRKHLTCLVPFIKNVTVGEILKIRNNEEEAFVRFRQALNKVIDESLASTSDFTERNANDIYQDIIRPELATLDQKVKRAHKAVLKGTAFKAIAWTGAIVFGLYTGILPDRLAGAAKALGLTKVLADIAEGALTRLNPERTIQCDGMYFLWKVKQHVSKRFSK